MRIKYAPETNNLGLVLPPDRNELRYLRREPPRRSSRKSIESKETEETKVTNESKRSKKLDFVERHHLYWPESLYETSDLANEFREHRFNSIWLLSSDHYNLHRQYQGVPIPPDDVMETFLQEAYLLDDLNISIKVVRSIEKAVQEDRVNLDSTYEVWGERLDNISYLSQRAKFEVMPKEVARLVLGRAAPYILAA